MVRCLLERHESLRLCFRSKLPDRWPLGEAVEVTVTLENEAGVLVREPYIDHVWTEPDSPRILRGKEAGIPLQVALEGDNADSFLLDVAGSRGGQGRGEKTTERDRCPREEGLVFDLSTGTARGSVTVFRARPCRERTSPRGEDERLTVLSSSTPRAETVDAEREEERKGRDLEEFVNSEIGAISLLVTFTREWAARFNRPVLPLGSLPACVSRACLVPRCCGESGEDKTSQKSPASSQRGARAPAWVARGGACNVRRLRFPAFALQTHADTSDSSCGGGGNICGGRTQEQQTSKANGAAAVACVAVAEASGDNDAESDGVETATKTPLLTKPSAPPKPPALSGTAVDTIELSAVESVSLGGFFGTVWDCSLALGAYLAAYGPEAVRGKRVVEVGAGCGVVSALCAAMGASEVVATDASDLLPLLALNAEQNNREGKRNVEVEEYKWGSPIQDRPALARGNFDVIICSDLIFDPAEWEALRESLSQLGGKNNFVVYLAHRTRNVQEREFFSTLEGFRCRKLEGRGGGQAEACRGYEGLLRLDGVLWRPGCFPDVALYELSPARDPTSTKVLEDTAYAS